MMWRDTERCQTSFLDWLDTLNDEERQVALKALRCVAHELGCVVERKPFLAHAFLDLETHVPAKLLLN